MNNQVILHHLGPYRFFVIPLILLLIIIEGVWSWRKNKEGYQIKETASNTIIFIGYFISKIISATYQLTILAFVSRFAPFHLPETIPFLILTFIAADLCFYWYHRVSSHTSLQPEYEPDHCLPYQLVQRNFYAILFYSGGIVGFRPFNNCFKLCA